MAASGVTPINRTPDGNYFWVPGTDRHEVKLLEYGDGLKIYLNRKCVAEYPLPADGVKNQRFSPEGMPPPRHQPHNRRRPTEEEEKRLRTMSPAVGAYLDFVLKGGGIQRHRFVRELFALTGRMPHSVFIQGIERALRYQIASLETVERIALLYMTQDVPRLPCVDVDEAYREREAYLEGNLTDAPDSQGRARETYIGLTSRILLDKPNGSILMDAQAPSKRAISKGN